MLIDTHAHVNFKAFEKDADEVIRRALDAVISVVNVGTQIDTSLEAVRLAEKFQILNNKFQINSKEQSSNYQNAGAYAVVGLHPVHTYSQHLDEEETSFRTREENFNTTKYRSICQSPKVVGIGECGLDYYRIKDDELGIKNVEAIKQLQKDAFIKQIRLAKNLNKALVIHCRPSAGTMDAYEDILKILDKEFENFQFPRLASRQAISNFQFEIHSFTGSSEIAQEFLKRGAYVGLNGIITFDKTGNMEQVVKAVPLDRIVLETDCPYLTPVPHRGHRNEPLYVKYVAEKVAQVKNLSVDEIAEATTNNAQKLFRLT